MKIVLEIVIWYALGLVGAGWMVGEAQRIFAGQPEEAKEEWRGNLATGMGIAVFGPVVLVIGFFISGFGEYGWYKRWY